MVFESGGTIRAVMMCIHAYFNIWCQAKDGWKIFIKRRTAVKKISLLPVATPEQIAQHADVCAICYQELLSARITRCRHFFHGVCLRKWLYVQDSCPLCHEIMFNTEDANANAAQPAAAAAQPPVAAAVPAQQLAAHIAAVQMQIADAQQQNAQLAADLQAAQQLAHEAQELD